MTKKSFSDKHGEGIKVRPDLADIVRENSTEGKLPCAVAFKIAREMNLTPTEVGVALDILEIKISKCQMGIFGYGKDNKFSKPMKDVPVSLEKAIRKNLAEDKLACRDAWQIAEILGIGKMDVTAACDAMGIKVSPCQLGAF
jgi:hypothetical protein